MCPSRQSQNSILGVIIALLLATNELPAQTNSDSRATGQPNIIFILADDQGWNGTSVQMHPEIPDSKSDYYRTPNLEKLAESGMRFSQAYAPGPMCSPTRASLQTGKSPAQLHMTNVGGGRQQPVASSQKLILPTHSSTLPTEEVTIGEVLQRAGYATAWFGKWHLGGEGPNAHGYDVSDGPTGNADGNTDDPNNPKDIFGITERGIAFMERSLNEDKPFYLQLWHYAVHGPVQASPGTIKANEANSAGKVHDSASFAAMTEDLDTGVGMILDKVRELGIEENTYVIYMSDHGAGRNLSSNAPLNRGKGTLWEGGVRVPLIISGPGVEAGKFCDAPTAGWDLFPTFCDLAGLDDQLPKGVEGVSLRPLFKADTRRDRSARQIAFHFPHYGQGGPHSTISMDGYKLIKLYDDDELKLFDLGKDIGEQNDLSQLNPAKTEQMHQSLMQYLKQINAGIPSANPNFDPNAVAQQRAPGGRQGGPGGRRGRRGPSVEQIAERQKELATLSKALSENDMETAGRLINEWNQAMDSSPARRRRPAGTDGTSPRQRRQQELKSLANAFKEGDKKLLADLVEQMDARLKSDATQASERSRPTETQ